MFRKTGNALYGATSVYYTDGSAWVWSDDYSGGYIYSTLIGTPRQVNGSGTKYYPEAYMYNGKQCFKVLVNGSYYYVWKDYNSQYWIASACVGFISPASWYRGDIGGTLYKIEGSGVASFTLPTATIIGRRCATINGVYEFIVGSGLSTNIYVGWRSYPISSTLGSGILCETSETLNSKSIFKFWTNVIGLRYCWYDGSKWNISAISGTADATVGYWQKASGAEPDGTYNLVYSGDIPNPTPDSYTVSGTITYSINLPYENVLGTTEEYITQVGMFI